MFKLKYFTKQYEFMKCLTLELYRIILSHSLHISKIGDFPLPEPPFEPSSCLPEHSFCQSCCNSFESTYDAVTKNFICICKHPFTYHSTIFFSVVLKMYLYCLYKVKIYHLSFKNDCQKDFFTVRSSTYNCELTYTRITKCIYLLF